MANILLIDDDEDIHEIVHAFLSPCKHELSCASSGQAGLDLIAAAVPDLIILDLAMPTMGGHETYLNIRENPATSATPVMILSVHADHEVTPDMEADPHVSTLLKPINLEQLIDAVSKALKTA